MKDRQMGKAYVPAFVDLGGLQPDHAVLEPGCGTGRMAVALTEFLTPDGSYDGFDIVQEAVDWCVAHITPDHPNFRFRHVDVANPAYNPEGKLDPGEFAFPYPDAGFDFVFLTSVFTHMLPRDIQHYLSEIRRVLRPRGSCLMTFFLLNDDAREAIREGRSHRRFEHEGDGYFYDIEKVHEGAVAYREEDALSFLQGAGFGLRAPIKYGRWAGRPGLTFGQDFVVVEAAEA
jgi:ubiquinone/menaquinone biosynthesis C-methylase UbiE